MASRFLLLLLAAIAGCVLALCRARPALAETLRLRSGRALRVDEVRVRERALSLTLRTDGGVVRMDLPFERFDPRSLLAALDRHLPAGDAAARLRTARLALELDLRGEAALRFHQAAALDPALASERDAGLAVIRALEAADALVDLETRLRGGADPRGVLALASALLEGPHRASLTPVQVLRVRVLAGLARGLVQRQGEPQVAADETATPAPAPPVTAALPADLAARLRGEETKARTAREAAADPTTGARRAARHLETAARALLQGRRLLRGASAEVQASAEDVARTLHELLVATYLDLADLYRLEGRFAEARARVRAALILDPGNEQAWEQRRLIEEDLRVDPFVEDPYYGLGYYDPLFHYDFGYPYGLRLPYRYARYGAYRVPSAGGVFGLGFHHYRQAGRGSRRVVGTRRTP